MSASACKALLKLPAMSAMENIMKLIALSAALLGLVVPAAVGAQDGVKPAPAAKFSQNFVYMPEINVPIVDAGRLDGILRIKVVLQPRSDAAAIRLATRMPELRAAGLSAAIEYARLYASPYTPIDVEKLTAAMATSLTSVDGGIGKVLIVKVTAKTA